jgi:hypothetical protein
MQLAVSQKAYTNGKVKARQVNFGKELWDDIEGRKLKNDIPIEVGWFSSLNRCLLCPLMSVQVTDSKIARRKLAGRHVLVVMAG